MKEFVYDIHSEGRGGMFATQGRTVDYHRKMRQERPERTQTGSFMNRWRMRGKSGVHPASPSGMTPYPLLELSRAPAVRTTTALNRQRLAREFVLPKGLLPPRGNEQP